MSGEQDREFVVEALSWAETPEDGRLGHEKAERMLADLIAQAEQRGREDNERHDMCYVHGSKALAEHERRVRVEALREAAFDLRDRRDRVGSIALPADAAFATCIDLLTTRADRIEADS